MWEKAEGQLREILTELGVPFYEAEGEAAFYGPKLDVQLKSAVGHDVTVSTCQLDFLLPERFKLEYIGEDGEKHRPVVIHRAILGTFDSNLRVVVFGNLDKTMLKYTASFYSLGDVAFSTSWFLAKRIWDFSTFISRYVVNMENGGKAFSQLKLMEIFSVLPCGQAHDSYNDAFNLLNLYDKVTKSPEILADNYLKILLNDSNKLKESNFMFEILKRIINGETITKNKLMELLIEYFE